MPVTLCAYMIKFTFILRHSCSPKNKQAMNPVNICAIRHTHKVKIRYLSSVCEIKQSTSYISVKYSRSLINSKSTETELERELEFKEDLKLTKYFRYDVAAGELCSFTFSWRSQFCKNLAANGSYTILPSIQANQSHWIYI